MIRHAVCFRWTDAATAEQRAAALDALAALRGQVAHLGRLTFGADAGLGTGNFDAAVVTDFDTAEDYRAYAEHPEHVRVLAEKIRPILADRAAVQFEVG